MQFSLFFFAAEADDGNDVYRLLLESARFADDHAFEGIWTPERHFSRFGGPYPNPALTNAALAVMTSRLRIRTGGLILPLHSPIRVAENLAVVDNLSRGRVEAAFVSGSNPNDYAIRPEAAADREQLLRNGVDEICALWRGERRRVPVSADRDVEIEIFPKPVQSELPIWRVCNRVESCAIAGAHGVKLLTSMLFDTAEGVREKVRAYKQAAHEHGESGYAALMVHAFVDPHASELAWPAYRRYLEVNLEMQRTVAAATGRVLPEPSADDRDFMFENAFHRLQTTHGLIGSVDDCVAKVDAYRNFGIDEIACLIDFGIPTDWVLNSLSSLHEVATRCAGGTP